MADVGCRVLWCPGYTDRFVTLGHGQDLKLYKVQKVVRANQDSLQRPISIRSHDFGVSEDNNAVLMSRISYISFRCVALYPKGDLDNKVLIALGQLNGTVTVRTFDQTKIGPLDSESEFVPRQERPCNTLAWNPVNSNLLAAGLERARNDVSLLVWDINSRTKVGISSGSLEKMRSSLNSSSRMGHSYLPDNRLVETGLTFETTSIAWFSTEPNSLIAGQGGKFLKIFDIRDRLDNLKSKQYANTKAVHGVCIDPNFENRVASFVEGHQGLVLVWDTRQFEKPLLVLPQGEQITQIDWNPSRSGLLACLRKDSNVVQLCDIQYGSPAYGNMSNEAEPDTLEANERHTGAVDFTISGFSWHPTGENRMLTISPKEKVRDLTIFEPICLSWSPGFSLTWGCGRHLIQCNEEFGRDEDMSLTMYKRACNSYGINWNKTLNIDDPKLAKLWAWFSRIMLVQKTLDGKFKMVKFPGVKTVLCGETGTQGVCPRSESFKDARMLAMSYYSDERYIALQLCNWDFVHDNGSKLRTFLQELAANGKFERAAAIAVFHHDIPSAINILTAGASERLNNSRQDPFLGMVAMALSGYTGEKKALWRDRSLSLCTQLSDPYLRAVFIFLSCDDDFTDVLKGCNLEIEDKVAFACKYLPDGQLGNYLSDFCKELIKSGNLEGILVTGMTEDGINLLQNYINMTGDIQTVCLLAINSLPNKLIGESIKVNNWIQSYRDLLDRWKLWHQRAEFDIYHHSKGVSVDSEQVLVSCTFCGSSILAQNSIPLSAGRLRYLSKKENPANKVKSISCPGCRKPLPRCSQCLMHMGTTSTSFSTKNKASNVLDVEDTVEQCKVNPTLKWFTWCQTCRHGGHASHMTEWFNEHSECPVNNCDCNCMHLDPVKQ